MSFVRTMAGDIAPEEMGFTYSHEHLVCIPPYWEVRRQDDLLLDDPEKSYLDMLDYKNAGGKTIVDATCIDYGRDVETVFSLAQKLGIQIIATTGLNKSFLWDARIPNKYNTFLNWVDSSNIDDLANWMIGEVEKGIGDTNIRCGQIKFGTGYNCISPLEIKLIRACCQTHKATKAPIHSHTEHGTMALEQIEYLREEGIELSNISFGHMDRNLDSYMHLKVADTGAFLSFDGIGKTKYGSESARIDCILELVRHGYKGQILISGDTARKSYYKHYSNGPGLEYIIKKWIPIFIEQAEEKGFNGEALVEDFFINNPARCFSFK